MIFRRRLKFTLRSLLAGITWTALVIALCVGQQQAASRQRANIERLKAAGLLPVTLVNGQPVAAQSTPAAP